MKSTINACLAALLLSTLSLANAEPPVISDARIVQPPPGAKVAAAYFTIRNNSEEPLEITGASSAAIANISIHLSAIVDDVAKMIPQDSVTIDAGSLLEFKHGSYHLMLMGLNAPLTQGSMLAIDIDTSAGVIPLMIPVITPDEASAMKSHSMDHDTMNHDDMNHDSTNKRSGDMNHNDSMNHDDMNVSKSTDKNE